MWVQYYDATSLTTAFGILLIPLLFVGFGFLMIKGIKNGVITYEDREERYNLFFMHIWTGLTLVITIVVAIGLLISYNQLLDVIAEKKYTEVEGFVKNYVQDTKPRIKRDSFTVDTIRFGCRDGESGFGFGKTKANGSPVYEGRYVKIHCFEGQIFKLWVKETPYSHRY
jgi:hypothetical protein